jgi:hypothetical protein
MKRLWMLNLLVVLSLVLGSAPPALLPHQQPTALAQENSPDEILWPEAIPILTCTGTGTGGDLADLRGIRFTVSQSFDAIETRFDASSPGTYSFTAEIRRSSGFLGAPIATATASIQLPGSIGHTPYKPVRFNFGNIAVSGAETFTVKFTGFSGPGIVYFETFGIGNAPCPNVEQTNENNVADPTVRGDPAGFKVLAPNPSSFSLSSTFTNTPPKIDGVLDFGEWNYSNRIPFDNGFITVMNDGMRLYVLLDVLGDTTNDPRNDDYFWVAFDVNRNGVIDANQDLLFAPDPNGNLRYSYFLGPNSWTTLQPTTYSSRAKGFGCFWGDGSFTLTSLFPLQFTCSQHRLWELAFDLAEIGSHAPGAARIGLRVASQNPAFINEIPANIGSDFSNLIHVSLAAPPSPIFAPPILATVGFDSKPIEVTQAVQDMDNTLPLVKDKPTVARVYARTTGVATAQNIKVYLYGSSGGVDLPGSPLAVMYQAPTTINRNLLTHTANFLLPTTWDEGSVIFSARAANFGGKTASTGSQTLTFTAKRIPTYWIIPLNTGTAASPVLTTQARMDEQASYLKAVFPLANVNIVQKPHTVIGPTTVANAIQDLNTYYNSTVLAWVLTLIFTGKPPFTLPDQIYGFHVGGGGISDPVWFGGAGRVARGGGPEIVIFAHEINHNLDRSSNGTWGRHVNANNSGCGASGADSSWPYTNSSTNEIGFDTRLPWSSSGALSVVPNTRPDFMSYCQVGLPPAWISPYRWQNLFNGFTTVAHTAFPEQVPDIQDVYYISGSISRNPIRGELLPILVKPGIPSTDIVQGEYSIEILDVSGAPVSVTPFKIEFLDDPHEPVDTVHFNFQIPVQDFRILQTVGKVVLKHGEQVLDQIVVSNNPPSIEVLQPAGGEVWGGLQTVSWQASDSDGDPLTFTVLYSPDAGLQWFPVAAGIQETSLIVDVSALPGGEQAFFRVIASDGFHNAEDDSGLFTVGDNPPFVYITSPEQGSVSPPGVSIRLLGDAHDPEDEFLPDEAFVWTLGEAVLGVGREVDALLSPGWHTLTLNVADSAGNTGISSIEILVGGRIFLPTINRSNP